MIKRFVKMTFLPQHIEEFKEIFNTNKHLIASFNGCSHVELLQDVNNPCVFFTYSIWENEINLNLYRESDLFNSVWSKTKTLFDAKPEAWSLQVK
jgi:heme-degrading monooxygenase HmoA